jgi:hypothetical protein
MRMKQPLVGNRKGLEEGGGFLTCAKIKERDSPLHTQR